MVVLQDAGSVTTMESMGVPPLKSPPQTLAPQPGPLAPSAFRKVRFAAFPRVELIATVREMDASQRSDLWYTSADFEEFKAMGRMCAKETRLQGPSVTLPVEQAYAVCQLLKFCSEDEEYRFLLNGNQNFQILKQHAAGLCTWAQRKQSCRGLEHWTSKAFYTARVETKNEVWQAVIEAYGTKEDTARISKQAQKLSRASRILARLFGLADSQFKTNTSKQQMLTEQILHDYHRQRQTRKEQESNVIDNTSVFQEGKKKERTILPPSEVTVPSPRSTRPVLPPSPRSTRPVLPIPIVPPASLRPSRNYVRTAGVA